MSYVLIYGINAVTEALRAGRVTSLQVTRRADERIRALLALAQESSSAFYWKKRVYVRRSRTPV